MFTLKSDERLLSFTVERAGARVGDGTRTLFWIDREQGVLQRGRQEQIPLGAVSGFRADGDRLICYLGGEAMTLYSGEAGEAGRLAAAAAELAEYCGIEEQ